MWLSLGCGYSDLEKSDLTSAGAGAKEESAELASIHPQVRELEGELDSEQKKMAEAQKGIRKYERRIKELSYQVRQHRAQLQPSRTWPRSPCAQSLVLPNTPAQHSPGSLWGLCWDQQGQDELLPGPASTTCSVSLSCPFAGTS